MTKKEEKMGGLSLKVLGGEEDASCPEEEEEDKPCLEEEQYLLGLWTEQLMDMAAKEKYDE